MPSLVAKTVRGRKYWQIVESRRVNGQPRSFVLAHLGRPETLLARLRQAATGARLRSAAHGAVAALWTQVQRLGVIELIDAHATRDRRGRVQQRDGLTPGQSLALAAVARACRPVSKRAFAAWARTTTLARVAGIDPARLTSQHFWDQMDAVPAGALAAIEEALVRRVVAQEGLAPDTLFYDTTNFLTFIASGNAGPPCHAAGTTSKSATTCVDRSPPLIPPAREQLVDLRLQHLLQELLHAVPRERLQRPPGRA